MKSVLLILAVILLTSCVENTAWVGKIAEKEQMRQDIIYTLELKSKDFGERKVSQNEKNLQSEYRRSILRTYLHLVDLDEYKLDSTEYIYTTGYLN